MVEQELPETSYEIEYVLYYFPAITQKVKILVQSLIHCWYKFV